MESSEEIPPGLPTATLLRDVTDTERASFDADGVAHLKNIYPTVWTDYLEYQLDDIFDAHRDRDLHLRSFSGEREQGARVDMAVLALDLREANPGLEVALEGGADADVVGRSIVETDAAHWHPGIRAHHLAGPIPDLIASLTGSAKVNFYSDQLFLKEPGSRMRTPFHQDEPYFLVQGQVAVAWVPVDVVGPTNGPMGYVKGSHRWGRVFKPSDLITDTGTFFEVDGIDHSALDLMPPITPDTHDVVYFDAQPGDVIVHHWSTIHGAAGNVSATATRRAASIRYAVGDSTYYQRPSSPEPFRHSLNLRDGDPLENADRFPIVWPRN